MLPRPVTGGPIEGRVVVEKTDGVVVKAIIENSETETLSAASEAGLAALVIATGRAAIASDDKAILMEEDS